MRRVQYELSELENSLRPIISAMDSWGVEYLHTLKEMQEAE
ncbi:winged helix-turn-helix transcriptional regulator [Terribacillus saccharophilus]